MLKIFLNEVSLKDHYLTIDEFDKSIDQLIRLYAAFERSKIEQGIFHDSSFLFNKQLLKNEIFISLLHKLRTEKVAAFFDYVLQRTNSQDWRSAKVQDSDSLYHCLNPKLDVRETSLAEMYERYLSDLEVSNKYIAINFRKTSFSDEKIEIFPIRLVKNELPESLEEFDSFESEFQLKNWLEAEFKLSQTNFNSNAGIRPTTRQTILRDRKRFRSTGKTSVINTVIYIEIETGYSWYLDNFHVGKASHLEVFDNNENHLGEADLDGNLLPGTKDQDKNLFR